MKCEIPVVKLHGSTFKLIQNESVRILTCISQTNDNDNKQLVE